VKSAPTSSGNPYENPQLLRWTDSYEGLPEIAEPSESQAESARRKAWGTRAHELFGMAGTLVPGVALAVAIAFAGEGAAALLGRDLLGFEKSPVSGIGVAVLLGLAIRHWLGLPAVYDAGLRLAVKRILRIGVALLGIRLSLGAAGRIGLVAAPIALACIATALQFVTWLGQRLGLERRLALLIAVGTSICGNTAIVATAPVIGANDDETSYAVGCITIFGLLALLVYPALSHLLFAGDATQAGIFLGIAIHDTAQVAGAGLMYAQQYGAPVALEAATVTKLVRNLFMLAVIPLVGAWFAHYGREFARKRTPFSQLVPLFVLGFVAMTALRTVGDLSDRPFGVLSPESWHALITLTTDVASLCLATAMAAIGLGTSITKLRGLGARPLGIGLVAALLVGALGFALIRI
jgi:uncharacterized integral membrane protein (TIGR00698 family)